MALNIKNPRAEQLAREVARRTGESMTKAVIVALEDRLRRLQGRVEAPSLLSRIQGIRERCMRLPDLDERSPYEILGYDQHGTLGDLDGR